MVILMALALERDVGDPFVSTNDYVLKGGDPGRAKDYIACYSSRLARIRYKPQGFSGLLDQGWTMILGIRLRHGYSGMIPDHTNGL